QRPDDRDLGLADLPHLGSVDVEVDHLRPGRERGDLAGDAIVEARADGDHEIGLVERPVAVLRAVHPRRAVVERMRVRQAALAHTLHDRRQARAVDEVAQLTARVAVEHAAAGVDDRPLGLADRLRRGAYRTLVDALRWSPARQVDVLRIREVELRLLRVL